MTRSRHWQEVWCYCEACVCVPLWSLSLGLSAPDELGPCPQTSCFLLCLSQKSRSSTWIQQQPSLEYSLALWSFWMVGCLGTAQQGGLFCPDPVPRSDVLTSLHRLDTVPLQPPDHADAQQHAPRARRLHSHLGQPSCPTPAEQDLGAGASPAAVRTVRDAVWQRRLTCGQGSQGGGAPVSGGFLSNCRPDACPPRIYAQRPFWRAWTMDGKETMEIHFGVKWGLENSALIQAVLWIIVIVEGRHVEFLKSG